MSQRINKTLVYSWAAYMWTHQKSEMQKFLSRGTPSAELIKLSETPVGMILSDGKFKVFTFPVSLNKVAGQNALFNALVAVKKYVYTIPVQAYELLQDIKSNLRVRRADAKANILMVAEAICHRAANEFKHEVLFAFDSINVWINAVYKKQLGYLTIRKALEVLRDQGFFKVNEWGKQGNRSKCTKIEILPKEYILTYTSNVDDWLLYTDHAMNAVIKRESATRQDVLEMAIHHFADQVAAEEEASRKANQFFSEGRRLFAATDDRMATDESTQTVVQMLEKEIFDETYIDRLLGRMVPALQETIPIAGQDSTGIP